MGAVYSNWSLNKTDTENAEARLGKLVYEGDEVDVSTILADFSITDVDHTLVTLKGTRIAHNQRLSAGDTTQESPLQLENCIVWINKDGVVQQEEYQYSDALDALFLQPRAILWLLKQ